MKITYAQINTIPGNFSVNFNQVTDAIQTAVLDQSDILVFPELTLCGYGVKDLMYNPGFVEKNLMFLQAACQSSVGYKGHIFIGYIDNNMTGAGKPFRNMVAVIHNGVIVGRYAKWLLPFYDVFDEGRYYEPGNELCIIKIAGKRVGVLVCEDLWNDKGQDDYNHKTNPVAKYREAGVDMIVSLNSSPYTKGKPSYRAHMLGDIVRSFPDTFEGIVYCNQYGAQDELVFDGNSMFINNRRDVRIAPPVVPTGAKFAEGRIVTIDTDRFKTDLNTDKHVLNDDDTMHFSMCMTGVFDYARKTGFKGIVLGSSGGIDSAVVIAMGTVIFGKENVYGIRMPSIYNSQASSDLAERLHKNLGCNDFLVPIRHMDLLHHINVGLQLEERDPAADDRNQMIPVEAYKKLVQYNEVADENLQSRMRGQVSMHMANALGLLAVGTCNKCEAATGYFTLFGDSANLFNPLIDLYKLEVVDFARFLNHLTDNAIPQEIITRPPTAELKPGQTDEASLMPYKWLDRVVRLYIEKNVISYDMFCAEMKVEIDNRMHIYGDHSTKTVEITEKEYNRIVGIIERNEFKRRLVSMGPKLTKKSFGTGRRVPVVKG
jgi:NAD+ synthetase